VFDPEHIAAALRTGRLGVRDKDRRMLSREPIALYRRGSASRREIARRDRIANGDVIGIAGTIVVTGEKPLNGTRGIRSLAACGFAAHLNASQRLRFDALLRYHWRITAP
jgi:hypothetical protein